MSRIVFGNSCPVCGTVSLERIQRKDWMKMVPLSKYYRCKQCRARALGIGGFVTIRLKSFS